MRATDLNGIYGARTALRMSRVGVKSRESKKKWTGLVKRDQRSWRVPPRVRIRLGINTRRREERKKELRIHLSSILMKENKEKPTPLNALRSMRPKFPIPHQKCQWFNQHFQLAQILVSVDELFFAKSAKGHAEVFVAPSGVRDDPVV